MRIDDKNPYLWKLYKNGKLLVRMFADGLLQLILW
jgi:hypothetical protein